MRLGENKEDIIKDNIYYRFHNKECNPQKSNWDIWLTQDIGVADLTTSTYLIETIRNEISRE